MFKLLLFISFLSFFFVIPNKAFAASCTVQIKTSTSNNSLPTDFNNDVEIIPDNNNCFPTSQDFVVGIYPTTTKDGKPYSLQSAIDSDRLSVTHISYFATSNSRPTGSSIGEGVNCTIPPIKPDGSGSYCGELQGNLDLARECTRQDLYACTAAPYFQGKDHSDQTWAVFVCVGNRPSACLDGSNLIGSGVFKVEKYSPTLPPDLPEIDLTNQKCILRSGLDNIENVKVTKIYPQIGVEYQWWWDGSRDYHHFAKVITGNETEFSFSIKADGSDGFGGTANLDGEKKLCVDNTANTRSYTQPNCVTIHFQKGAIDAGTDTSCNATSRGPAYICTKALEDTCRGMSPAQVCSNGKCVPGTSSAGDPCDGGLGIKTAIGCVHTKPAEFVKDFLTFIIGISGGLAFLMMLLGAFQMLTSAGNPDTLKAGQDRLKDAIIGLLFVIFAVLLLQIIGVGILNIPGFQL